VTAIETIRQNVSICLFDLYGTVVDMQTRLGRSATGHTSPTLSPAT